MKKEYRKVLALSTIPIVGSYKYKNVFQIIQADSKAPKPPALMNHHPCIVEFNFVPATSGRKLEDGHEIPAWVVSNEISGQAIKELLLLFTAFTDSRVFQYTHNQAWFIPIGGEKSNPADKVTLGLLPKNLAWIMCILMTDSI